MNKAEVIKALEDNYQEFIQYVDQLTLDEYEFGLEGKWTAGQQVEHLIRSTTPLNTALGLPRFILKMKFGKANRPSKSYDDLVAKYKSKLEQGGKSFGKYNPPPSVKSSKRSSLSKKLAHNIKVMSDKLQNWTEKDLDHFIVPHPLLGKVTIREILYFTAYHSHHHQMLIKHYLKGV